LPGSRLEPPRAGITPTMRMSALLAWLESGPGGGIRATLVAVAGRSRRR
jgi:hypothetical protein